MVLGKHFINGVSDPVERALRTLLLRDESLRLIEAEKVLFRDANEDKVLLLSGGGSGHEPAHAGYVGHGMLDVAIAGNVFASPSASQILAGLGAMKTSKGTLMIVKSYTGDILNFGLAAEKAKAEGKKVNVVFVTDDVSIENNSFVRPRGLAGTVFVHKIAGAAAANGWSLDEVTKVAQKAADSVLTMGVSLDRCSVPQRQNQESLPFEEFEYGMGIHNEPGAKRCHIAPLDETVKTLISALRKKQTSKSNLAVLVNNLGGLSILELNVIAEEVMQQTVAEGITVDRLFVGSFVTSLDAPGFSVTFLRLDNELLSLLDEPTEAPGWQSGYKACSTNSALSRILKVTAPESTSEVGESKLPLSGELTSRIIKSIAATVQKDEPLITKYDTIAGDGDCGETLLNGVNALVRDSSLTSSPTLDIAYIFKHIATLVERNMGGTSGALYAIFFNAVSGNLSNASCDSGLTQTLAASLQHGLNELCRYTTARKGHRTLMDALIPFVETFAETKDLKLACDAASKGAESTRNMEALLGRASYVAKEEFEREGGIPDPGSIGVASVVKGIVDALV